MNTTPNIPDFHLPRQHGPCPACDHSGTDCRCHEQPQQAGLTFAKRQLVLAAEHLAVAMRALELVQSVRGKRGPSCL